ncbi:hypothetical protein MTO96_039753 [Rhipicephalus appendiculatus]
MNVFPNAGCAGGQHLTASKDCAQRFQIPNVLRRRRGERGRAAAARSESPASLASEDHSQCPSVDNDATGRRARFHSKDRSGGLPRWRSRSRSRGRSRSRSRSISRDHSVSRNRSASRGQSASKSNPTPSVSRTSTAAVSDDGRKRKKPTLSWADRVKGSAGSTTVSDSREPEQTRDVNELEKLRKENETLKATIERMASEIAEIKNLALRHAQAPEVMDVFQRVAENSGAAKRRAVDSKHCSEVSEIKSIVSQAAENIKALQQGLSQIQVALGDPHRGLAALAERIDRIEKAVPPAGPSVAAGETIPRTKRIIVPPTDGELLRSALTSPNSSLSNHG